MLHSFITLNFYFGQPYMSVTICYSITLYHIFIQFLLLLLVNNLYKIVALFHIFSFFNFNRTSWSAGKGILAEVFAITSSSSGHSRFNMVSVWPPGSSSPVPVGRGRIVGLSERSGYLDYRKKKNYNNRICFHFLI